MIPAVNKIHKQYTLLLLLKTFFPPIFLQSNITNMSFTQLIKISVFLFVSLLCTNFAEAQVFAALDTDNTEERSTEMDNTENNAWVSVAETVLYSSKIDKSTTLAYTLTKAEKITVDLSDMQGRILKKYTRNAKRSAGDYQQKIVLPFGLPKGTYFLNISSASDKVTVKVRHD